MKAVVLAILFCMCGLEEAAINREFLEGLHQMNMKLFSGDPPPGYNHMYNYVLRVIFPNGQFPMSINNGNPFGINLYSDIPSGGDSDDGGNPYDDNPYDNNPYDGNPYNVNAPAPSS